MGPVCCIDGGESYCIAECGDKFATYHEYYRNNAYLILIRRKITHLREHFIDFITQE